MFRHHVAIVLIAAALLAGVTVAFAQSSGAKKPLGKMTCEEFLVIEDAFEPKVVYWAAAYGEGGKPEAAVLDVEGTEKVVPIIVEERKKGAEGVLLAEAEGGVQETREEGVTGRVTVQESSGPQHNRNLNALSWRMP